MPRQRRLHIEGGCYHVMGHRHLFLNVGDKVDSFERLGISLKQTVNALPLQLFPPHKYHAMNFYNSFINDRLGV